MVVAAFTFKQRKDRNQANTVSVKLDDFFLSNSIFRKLVSLIPFAI